MKFHESNWKPEIWLLLSKSYKVSTKKVNKNYLSLHWSVMQSLKKNWVAVSNMTSGIRRIFTKPLNSPKILLWWALFCPKYIRFELQNYRGVTFHDTEQWPCPCGFKNGMESWVNFHLEHSKVLNILLWWDLFVQII